MITMRFDGLFRCINEDCAGAPRHGKSSNSGVMCYGWLIYRDGVLLARGHGGYARHAEATSNIAEYLALIEGLQALTDMHLEKEAVEIIGDARSVIDQMTGSAGVNSLSTRPLYRKARRLAKFFKNPVWIWTPRQNNHAADLLTRRAMKQIRADQDRYREAIQRIETPSLPARLHRHLFSLLDLTVFQPAGSN